MYSIVLLTAFTATPDTPQFNGYFRDLFHRDSNGCNGCNGCSGAARYNCTGCSGSAMSSSSCSGSCTGCCGGGHIFGLGERVRSWFEGSNCCGTRNYNCTGATFASSSCCGSSAYSCFGGPSYSYTPMFNGGLSCQGGIPMSAPPPMFDTFPTPSAPGVPGMPWAVPQPAPGTIGMRPSISPATYPTSTSTLTSNGATGRATVIVRLPVDARLYADSRAMTLTGAERKFVSPELPLDQEFVYRFKAEYERDGETVSVTKKVTVRAGTTVMVEFTDLTATRPATNPASTTSATGLEKGGVPSVKPTVQEPVKTEPPIKPLTPTTPTTTPTNDVPALPGGDRATITVKLPPGATLYVDDRKSPSQDPVRSFSTPPLPNGREYAYLLKAEVVRNGQPETLTQKVPFRAGERVIVDFTSLGK
jgi:uncharacterized protein (TIGR03000 family)